MTFDDLDCCAFPFKKPLGTRDGHEWFAYIIPLTFGRSRVNVTYLADAYSVREFY